MGRVKDTYPLEHAAQDADCSEDEGAEGEGSKVAGDCVAECAADRGLHTAGQTTCV